MFLNFWTTVSRNAMYLGGIGVLGQWVLDVGRFSFRNADGSLRTLRVQSLQMCARFSLYATPAQIASLLELDVKEVEPRYNIAPSQMVLGAIERNGVRELREFRWGLIPSWAKDAKIGSKMINARAETIMEKPAFRNAFQKRRCVIPASGFYEWKHETIEEEVVQDRVREGMSLFEEYDIPKRKTKSRVLKQPFLIGLKAGEAFGLAGLYEYWNDPAGEKVRSCTILTTRPNELIAPIHDRMPVILRKADIAGWLDEPDLEPYLEPIPASEMTMERVSSAINDPTNERIGRETLLDC